MVRFATLFALLLLASGVSAQTPGMCSVGTAEADVNISDVFARVFNTGSLFYGTTTTNGDGYLVPKTSANSPLYAAGLWIGGRVGEEVRSARARYGTVTFWPGPLDAGGTLPNPADCSAFDRIYRVDLFDLQDYESGVRTSPDLAEWPVGLGAPSIDADGMPLAVTSRDQTLDLDAGERPRLYGSQTAFWVMNDVGRDHGNGPLGVEVRVTAFAISSANPGANTATFYRYEIINRGPTAITDMRPGFFVDPDLGGAGDDYMGTDRARGMVFVYNAEPVDNSYGTPPALGFDVLSGLETSQIPSGITPAATTPEETLRALSGVWADGTLMRENGIGYNQPNTFPVTQTMYPGDPVSGAYWSEENVDGTGTRNGNGDSQGIFAAPALTLGPGESTVVDLAILFAQGTDRLNSVTRLRDVSDAVQASYDAGFLYPQFVASEAAPEASGVTLALAPNPARGAATVRLTLAEASGVRVRVVDALGREVAVLADGPQAAGEHAWALPERLPSGVYAVEARTDRERTTARWTVVR